MEASVAPSTKEICFSESREESEQDTSVTIIGVSLQPHFHKKKEKTYFSKIQRSQAKDDFNAATTVHLTILSREHHLEKDR